MKRFGILAAAVLAAALALAGCSVTTDSSVVTAVSISGTASIKAAGSTALTASPVVNGTPTVTYTWSITSGGGYAELSASTGESVTLTGKNTTAASQTVVVKVVASDGSNSAENTMTVTVGALTTVTAVSAGTSSSSIDADGTATLTATPTYTGDSSAIDYTWAVTDGSSYASLSATTGSSVTLTAANSATSSESVTVKVTASDGTNSVSSTVTITVGAAAVESVSITGSSSVSTASPITLTAAATCSGTPAVTYTWSVDNTSYATLSATSGESVTLTGVTSGQSVTVTVSATDGTNTVLTTKTISVTANAISYTDSPTGFALYSDSSCFNNYSSYTTVTVSTHSALKTYAAKGGYIIYVSGMIDLSDGMIPTAYDGTTDTLDSFISTKSSAAYTSYSGWRAAYAAACATTTDDESSGSANSSLYSMLWTLSNAYKAIVQVPVASNTMIIGLDSTSGVKGGNISISGVSNVAIRNMTIQDAYDPFPHHENGDGYNSQYDGITIQGTNDHIWIDHCTFKDSFTDHVYVSTGGSKPEKWVTYDGLCDIKGVTQYVTVSYCKFMNHDKTMLIGSSDSETVNSVAVTNASRHVTLHHNYFYNCVQRLPMVRLTTIHIYNNYYDFDSYTASRSGASTDTDTISSSYAIGVRYSSKVYAENNYIGSGITYSVSGADSKTTSKQGEIYLTGNTDNSSKGQKTDYFITDSTAPFTPTTYYTYTADDAATAKTDVTSNAGAGVWAVSQ